MNIVCIVIDSLRYDYIGVNGNNEIKTPHLDQFAEKSWNFHRAFAASFPTIPHRTDMLLGRYGGPFHPWKPLDCDKPTIPDILAEEKGYCTQLIHDTPHLVNGGHRFDYPFQAWTPIRGAEVDRAWITEEWEFMDNWEFNSLYDIYPRDKEKLLREQNNITSYVHTNPNRPREEDWNVARLFQTASQFLKDNQTRDNFFLWVDGFDPHEPWDSPPKYMKMYDHTPDYNGKIDPRAFKVRNNPELSSKARERIKHMYAAKVTFMDEWLGYFLETLELTGLDQNTAVILTADHGTNVGDGGEDHPFGKYAPVTENESHVPLMIYLPEGNTGESNIIVQPQDIFATIMNMVEAPVPGEKDSYDILKQVRDKSREIREVALAGPAVDSWEGKKADDILFSVFDKEWRLGFAPAPEACELQRLGSQEDVSSSYPEVVEELREKGLLEMEDRNLDPALLNWLKKQGQVEFPDAFKVTDANPAPAGWRSYFQNLYHGE